VTAAERAIQEAQAIVAAALLLAHAGFTIRQVRPVRRLVKRTAASTACAEGV
jgi:hypothetical protein